MADVPDGRLPKHLVSAHSPADDSARSFLLVHHGAWQPRLCDSSHRLAVRSGSRPHRSCGPLYARLVVPRPQGRARHPPPARCLHLFPPARALWMEQRRVRPILRTERYRPGTKASLAVRANSARSGGGAHAVCFALHVLLAAATLFAGCPWNALWVLLPGVIVHLYPTLLQRSILLRLQPLLNRAPAATS